MGEADFQMPIETHSYSCDACYEPWKECTCRWPLTVRSVDGTPCVFIAEINGREVGRMSITVLPLVHDMEIPPSTIQRKIADALFFYASGKVKAAGFTEAAVFVEDSNESMKRYVEARAVAEPASAVYMMGVS